MEAQENLSKQSGEANSPSSRLSSIKSMGRSTWVRLFLLLLIAGLIGYYIGVTKISIETKNFQPSIEVSSKEPPASQSENIDFSLMWTVMEKLAATYYDKSAINPQKFLDGAIAGMVASLDDPYTMYLPPAKNDDFKQGMAGQFEGIGAELGMKDKQIIVVAPLDGSPAKAAGIRSGDAIVAVNEESTNGWSLVHTVEKIRGPKGTEVKLTVVHKSDSKPDDIKIVRDTITVKSLTSWTKSIKDIDEINGDADGLSDSKDDEIVYIRLSQFGDSTNVEWKDLVKKVSSQLNGDKNIRGVVFDLRNNPGGYLNDAVLIASEFIPDGVVVSQEDRNGDKIDYKVTGKGVLFDVPLVVLINKGSASASEIVAGALRDHERATLVGDTSFGKGTIQDAEDLGGGAGLHVTIAKWLTPNGSWVHKKGLTPDVKEDLDSKDQSHDLQLEAAIKELLSK